MSKYLCVCVYIYIVMYASRIYYTSHTLTYLRAKYVYYIYICIYILVYYIIGIWNNLCYDLLLSSSERNKKNKCTYYAWCVCVCVCVCVCEKIIAICICAGDSDVANNYAFSQNGIGNGGDGEDKKKKSYKRSLTRERSLFKRSDIFFPVYFLTNYRLAPHGVYISTPIPI